MTPEERREAATELLLEFARDVERMSIREHLADSEHANEYDDADVNEISELISTATITIEWDGGEQS